MRRPGLRFCSALALCALLGCRGEQPSSRPATRLETNPPPSTGAPGPDSPPSVVGERPANAPSIVFLGDSLTAGLGLPVEESFPSLLQQRLDEDGYGYVVVNAGVSGDTSAGGLRRLDWSLEGNPKMLIVALGGNDGLRGLPPAELKKNLAAAIERGLARKLTVVLAGMEAPPNNGPEYTAAFRQVYADLAKQYDVIFVPFLLQGVAGDEALNQADGIHPNARGARIIADMMWKAMEPALDRPAAPASR